MWSFLWRLPALCFVRWHLSPWGSWPFSREIKPRTQFCKYLVIVSTSPAHGQQSTRKLLVRADGQRRCVLTGNPTPALPPLQLMRISHLGLLLALPILSLMADLAWTFGLEILLGRRARDIGTVERGQRRVVSSICESSWRRHDRHLHLQQKAGMRAACEQEKIGGASSQMLLTWALCNSKHHQEGD